MPIYRNNWQPGQSSMFHLGSFGRGQRYDPRANRPLSYLGYQEKEEEDPKSPGLGNDLLNSLTSLLSNVPLGAPEPIPSDGLLNIEPFDTSSPGPIAKGNWLPEYEPGSNLQSPDLSIVGKPEVTPDWDNWHEENLAERDSLLRDIESARQDSAELGRRLQGVLDISGNPRKFPDDFGFATDDDPTKHTYGYPGDQTELPIVVHGRNPGTLSRSLDAFSDLAQKGWSGRSKKDQNLHRQEFFEKAVRQGNVISQSDLGAGPPAPVENEENWLRSMLERGAAALGTELTTGLNRIASKAFNLPGHEHLPPLDEGWQISSLFDAKPYKPTTNTSGKKWGEASLEKPSSTKKPYTNPYFIGEPKARNVIDEVVADNEDNQVAILSDAPASQMNQGGDVQREIGERAVRPGVLFEGGTVDSLIGKNAVAKSDPDSPDFWDVMGELMDLGGSVVDTGMTTALAPVNYLMGKIFGAPYRDEQGNIQNPASLVGSLFGQPKAQLSALAQAHQNDVDTIFTRQRFNREMRARGATLDPDNPEANPFDELMRGLKQNRTAKYQQERELRNSIDRVSDGSILLADSSGANEKKTAGQPALPKSSWGALMTQIFNKTDEWGNNLDQFNRDWKQSLGAGGRQARGDELRVQNAEQRNTLEAVNAMAKRLTQERQHQETLESKAATARAGNMPSLDDLSSPDFPEPIGPDGQIDPAALDLIMDFVAIRTPDTSGEDYDIAFQQAVKTLQGLRAHAAKAVHHKYPDMHPEMRKRLISAQAWAGFQARKEADMRGEVPALKHFLNNLQSGDVDHAVRDEGGLISPVSGWKTYVSKWNAEKPHMRLKWIKDADNQTMLSAEQMHMYLSPVRTY